MNTKLLGSALAIMLATFFSGEVRAQAAFSEMFTGTTSDNDWYFFNGACLTAGTSTSLTSPGPIPACTTVLSSYYGAGGLTDPALVGGYNGYLGSTTAPASRAAQVRDPTGNGALRFTNGSPYGYSQSGAIVSSDTFPTGSGIQVTFKTVTYRGDSGGAGHDGADGISFYMMDGSQPAGIGAWGGSLAYSCSNSNPPYNGLVGGYIGLGIDEYGNFLNGRALMPGYTGTNAASGDNSALGYGYKPGRIGMRGAGNIAWSWLNANYPTYYPATLTAAQRQVAVQKTCQWGVLHDFSGSTTTTTNSVKLATAVPDYAPIPGAYKELGGIQIANESAVKRSDATAIFYNLKVTQDGLLSLSYSLNGGAYQQVIKNQDISASNGPLPATMRFGFAGSTGGSTNIHEILCFKAATADQSGSSATVNEKQAAKVQAGTQAYFAYFNPNTWTGNVTANSLIDSGGVISVATTANWDASCVLDGITAAKPCTKTGATTPLAALGPDSRVMLTWNGSAGVPFRFASLSAGQQSTVNALDAVATAKRVNFLRGDQTNEINSAGVGLFRNRDSILGDIVDSSPAWVGPPISPYTVTWKDRLNPATVMAENGGQSYASFVAAAQTRQNVIYAGANDGFLHGFRAGSFDSSGGFVDSAATPNDGKEVLAYMPGSLLQSSVLASSAGGCTDLNNTGTVAQNIHGVTPAVSGNPLCVQPELDFASSQYAHNFFVDASPGVGDLYYSGAWHTWLVGGLGVGGRAVYALDVTNPTAANFSETNAASLVVGEWNASTISCVNVSNCGNNLGNTYGTPQVRRMHNGKWAVIFGNGLGSASGDAGIFIMTVDSSGTKQMYYYSTGAYGSNGINYATPADLDGDHLTDYIYAGDLQGKVWRFDVTSTDAGTWAVNSNPLFATSGGQPITSQLLVVSTLAPGTLPRLMVEFGTGQRTQLTNTAAEIFATGSQSLYGVWDWNLSGWNALSPAVPYQSLAATNAATGLTSPYLVQPSNLQSQTFTINATVNTRDGTNNTVCWQGSTVCGASNNKYGWYVNLPGGQEQIIFNPVFYQGAFIVNSAIPANNSPTSCAIALDTGYTYAVSVANGGVFTNAFPTYEYNNLPVVDPIEAGIQTDATGSPYIVTTVEGTTNLVYQTVSGNPGAQQANIPPNTSAKRLTWIERR